RSRARTIKTRIQSSVPMPPFYRRRRLVPDRVEMLITLAFPFASAYNENEIHFHLAGVSEDPAGLGAQSQKTRMLQRRIDDHAPPSRESMREAQEIFYRHLKRVGLKHTDQRDTILRTFLETRDHLSTDELFRLVRKKDAKVGFTTVYRTLKLLAECGLASAV